MKLSVGEMLSSVRIRLALYDLVVLDSVLKKPLQVAINLWFANFTLTCRENEKS